MNSEVKLKVSPLGSNVYSSMEDIIEKLKLLRYEQKWVRTSGHRPLTKTYFAVPTSASEQFPCFSSLVLWLLQDCLQAQFEPWSEYEDPTSICSNILVELKKLGFSTDFPVAKLRHGSGPSICSVVDFLCNAALARQGFQVLQPVYEASAHDDADEIVEDEDVGEELEETIEELEFNGGDGDADMFGYYQTDSAPHMGALGSGGEESKQVAAVLESNVDSAQWQLELERVSSRLKVKDQAATREWRTHLEQAQKHSTTLESKLPASHQLLSILGQNLKKAVDRLSSKEQLLTKQFHDLGDTYHTHKNQLEKLQNHYEELHTSVNRLKSELSDTVEEVGRVKQQMQERNDAMTDTSPIRQISGAIAQLRTEISDMELRIGIVSQTLLQATANSTTQKTRESSLSDMRRASGRIGDDAGGQSDSENDHSRVSSRTDSRPVSRRDEDRRERDYIGYEGQY